MENQPKVITFGALGEYDNLRPQVKPVKATYQQMKEMREQGKLIPGQLYCITDYVTTVNGLTIPNARSAGHAFDIIVMAATPDTLSEDALAVAHEGGTYFKDARLEAWQLKYRLDNVQWSQQAGTYVTDEDNGYTFLVLGDITLQGHTYKLLQGFGMYVEDWSDYALMDTVEEGEPIYCYYGDPEEFDPEEPEVVGTASGVTLVSEEGKGTIVYMKDEWGNECPYDFKNVQFKRYMTTDSVSGREGLGGKYMVADPNTWSQGLSVEDTEDFIWAYTFSSDNAGGEQTDYSLTAEHQVHDNIMKPYSGGLPNNVMYGEFNYGNSFGVECYNNSWGNNCNSNSWGNDCRNNSWGNDCSSNSWGNDCSSNSWGNSCNNNSWGNNCYSNSWGNSCNNNSWGNYCYNNSWGNSCNNNSCGNYCYNNSWGNNCYNNSWGNDCRNNSWGNSCNNNSWGNDCRNNSWGNNCNSNSWGNDCYSNSWGNYCYNNSWGNYCYNNSWGNYCYRNSWGNDCRNNSWGNDCSSNSLGNDFSSNSWGNNVTYSTVFDGVQYTQITTENVKYVQVLNGVQGTFSSKLTLTFAANKTYTQVAAKTSAGTLNIYVPGDLA